MKKVVCVWCVLLLFAGLTVGWMKVPEMSGEKRGGIIIQTTAETSQQEGKKVALTFDDGPSCYTKKLLDGLKKRKVHATFFLQGQCIAGREAVVKQMQKDGHLIGNHTFHHVQLSLLSEQKAIYEITAAGNAIYEITGTYPLYIRPPFGEWKEGLELRVSMIPVLWSVDSCDWSLQNTPQIVKRVLRDTREGDIILMHDCYATSVEAALQLVDELERRGFYFVTADEMIDP
ncbi:MAG: polysaccharide deacetylase family protein [Lachnospiraceae bacterium]|nr:polysaccharide deacetylase family protein [Lachnospiraceae bacterium]